MKGQIASNIQFRPAYYKQFHRNINGNKGDKVLNSTLVKKKRNLNSNLMEIYKTFFSKRVKGEQEEARNKELRGFGHKNGRLGQGFTLLRR